MLLRRSSFMKENRQSERMILRLSEDEATFITGSKPSRENAPRVHVECAHGLLKLSAGKPGDKQSFNLWLVKATKKMGPMWETQLNMALFPGVRLASYEVGLTEVMSRKNAQTKELHAMLDMLAEGEEQSVPVLRGRGGKILTEEEIAKLRADRAAGIVPPKITRSKPAPKAAEKHAQAPVPAMQGTLLPALDGSLAQQINDRFGIADAERTMLRSAVDMLNAQIRRGAGSIRAAVDPTTGEVRLQVAKVSVTMEDI